MASIDAGERDVWIRMGFAVYSEFGDVGFEIWDDWARTWPDYRERDARTAWRSFGRGGGRRRVTIGSLFHLATERGWRRRPETQGQSHWDGRSRPVRCPSNAAAL